MGETLRKVCNIAACALAVPVIALAIALAGVRLFGLQVFIVLSGSMEPTYKTGSLIYVKKANCASLEKGDSITYRLKDGTVVTHRIVEVVPCPQDRDSPSFRTKGDANNAADLGGLVPCRSVIGKPVYTIPKLGYVAEYIRRPPGVYVAISVGALLLLLVFLPDVFGGGKRQKQSPPQAGAGDSGSGAGDSGSGAGDSGSDA